MLKCWHAFEHMCILANGDVVCSICEGRGDFVLGNVFVSSPTEIFTGEAYLRLRRLVMAEHGAFCSASGRICPLKCLEKDGTETEKVGTVRSLQIEPTTVCNLRCLTCLVRDMYPEKKQAFDGGLRYQLWDRTRRTKQWLVSTFGVRLGTGSAWAAMLSRGRLRRDRRGMLSLAVIKSVIEDLSHGLERIDFFNYCEPFVYPHLVDALRMVRRLAPGVVVNISTNGIPIKPDVEAAIIREGLVDWIVFSIDGVSSRSYEYYRVGGKYEKAWSNLLRFANSAGQSRVRVVWQYIVFRWNDSDRELHKAIEMAKRHDLKLWFEFTRTWGRSQRDSKALTYLIPHLKPGTSLPDGRGAPLHLSQGAFLMR
jgi:pyruvate-formate lyase-activating enzyme